MKTTDGGLKYLTVSLSSIKGGMATIMTRKYLGMEQKVPFWDQHVRIKVLF